MAEADEALCLMMTYGAPSLAKDTRQAAAAAAATSYQGLIACIDARAMEGMARDDLDILGQVSLKGLDLGVLAGSLAAYDSANLGCYTWPVP